MTSQKYIGEGSYGITYSPPFPCGGNVYYKGIGKIFYHISFAKDEIKNGEILKKIEKNQKQKYFSYPKGEICELKPIPQDPKILDFLKKHGGYRLYQVIMEHSGLSLREYLKLHYPNNNLSRSELIYLIENLFYAVKRLISYGYIHCDIKLDNIVISNTKRLRLIDFGLLQTEKNWYDVRMNFLFSDFYMKKQFIYPIEYDIMYSNNENLKNYKLKFDNYHETYTDHLKRYNPDPSVLKEFTDSLVVEDDPSLNSLHDIKKIKIFKDNKIHEKSDVFSIGAILIDISNNFLKPENDDDLEVVKLYTELMFGLLNFNPIKRLNINEAIKLVKQIKKYQKTDPFKTNKDSDELKIAVRDHSYSGSSYTYLIKKILNKLSREDLINCVLSNNN